MRSNFLKYYIAWLFLIILWASTAPLAVGQSNLPKAKQEKKQYLELEFSSKGGFYEESVLLELYSPGATIYYTTDGSEPTRRSAMYHSTLEIRRTAVIRAIALRGRDRSKIVAHTFFVNEPLSTFPVVSIAINPSVLFDPEKGLYMKGPNVIDSLWKKDGANFWSRKEVVVNSEIFEVNQECVFNSMTGFRLFGGMSRLFPQKSMTIVARDRYGKKHIKHPVFGKKGKKKHKFLVLRNSGSDWGKAHFRDGLMTSLLDDWDIEKQDFRPAHVYLNGTYWGIYNIREKINRYFIEAHSDIDNDSIDLMEHRWSRKRGSSRHYRKMIAFLERHSMRQPENYAYLKSQMDVENFMDYQIAQIFFDNKDAGGNIKYWRPQREDGKWRWILYDTDWGFGLHDPKGYRSNSLAFHTEPDGPSWPNPPWSTLILRKLLENPEFERQFINRFCDRLNTTFTSDRVRTMIDEFYTTLLPEMPRHLKRWRLRKDIWKLHIGRMHQFAIRRPSYVRKHLQAKFNTGASVDFSASAEGGGALLINENIRVESSRYEGQYFENIPISLIAIPNFGHRFSHWEGIAVESGTNQLQLLLNDKKLYHIKAVFEPSVHPLAGQLMINEVSPFDKTTGDWVELYNASEESVRLKNWILADRKHAFSLPDVEIASQSFLVICADTAKFRKVFPEVHTIAGNMNFGLHKRKERLGLYTHEGASVDSIYYEIEPMDSTYTLNLLLPHLENSDQENWEIMETAGTPAAPNPYYVESRIKAEQELWLRIGVSIGMLLCCSLLLYMKRRRDRLIRQN